ncbi:dTMP kinase [Thermomonospora cellulosilytica]|uniref:Thymidylate kinase n=1 Tax=Thermomonospora cellulosilytica TaxID=1411118 RepID=A0A7W3N1Q7_9ACTN|nr:dTMP kinase [Thermomonospora cellulosilytica]MBA9005930.1 dTMP kinase [Thermomonospora cellulosilytica]
MTATGRFLVLEGPNGVGKTTTAAALADLLRSRGDRVHVTGEPSTAPLGRLIRAHEAELTGRALALAVAADRSHHLDTEIVPALAASATVICDRFIPSSLVLQQLDGLDPREVWSYNAALRPIPDITVYLITAPATIGARLAQRPRRSRLEQAGSPDRELALYQQARRFLDGQGWRQITIDCRDLPADQVAARILAHLPRKDPAP